jgi:hypothetical protein
MHIPQLPFALRNQAPINFGSGFYAGHKDRIQLKGCDTGDLK